MKTSAVTIHLFEKGDRITTGYGEGTVVEDEKFDEYNREVKILLDDGCSEKPNGHRVAFFTEIYSHRVIGVE